MDVSLHPKSTLLNNDTLNKLAFVPILLLYRFTLTTDWGYHTGTIDWCETNYSHSPYIAEFVNTLTNLPTILLGIYGVWHTTQNGIPLRYGLCYLGLSLIGVGSFGFHASLRWEWQLMDELPMVSQVYEEKSISPSICLEIISVKERKGLIPDLPRNVCGLFDT